MVDWQVEPLAGHHARGEFSCGKAPLDVFLRTLVGQYTRRDIGRTYVAVRPGDPKVIGYYTLAASAVPFEQIPPDLVKRYPRHPVPAILLARLAVDVAAQGQRVGAGLLVDACRRAAQIADLLGAFAVLVDAIDDAAKSFYTRYEFRPLLDDDRRLLLPIGTVRQAWGME